MVLGAHFCVAVNILLAVNMVKTAVISLYICVRTNNLYINNAYIYIYIYHSICTFVLIRRAASAGFILYMGYCL